VVEYSQATAVPSITFVKSITVHKILKLSTPCILVVNHFFIRTKCTLYVKYIYLSPITFYMFRYVVIGDIYIYIYL